MSFNKQPIKIHRTNYEEAFLLYIDDELTAEQCSAVEAFAAEHPDLQEELNLLLTTKLDSETVLFEGKESLLAQNIKAATIDEALLLYIDNELPAAEIIRIEKRIKEERDYNEQYKHLVTTKLDSAERVNYPDKKDLYRSTAGAVRPIFWMRIAIAVILVLSASVFWLTGNNETETITPPVAITSVKKERDTISNSQNNALVTNRDEQTKSTTSPVIKATEKAFLSKEAAPLIAANAAEKKRSLSKKQQVLKLPEPELSNQIISAVDMPPSNNLSIKKKAHVSAPPSQQIINNPVVTTIGKPTYTTIDAATATDAGLSFAAASNSNKKQGSIRGFLRKATRFIERRTGIDPVNEDDKLLIGVVAIKL